MAENDKSQKLEWLYRRVQEDREYRTERMGQVFVPGRGNLEDGGLVFVGEAPGREEELKVTPFVGAAGRNLDALLREVGLERQRVFITNLIKYRPIDRKGGNRSPSTGENRLALPYLLEELTILVPSLVVCLGLSSAKSLLQKPDLKMSGGNGALFDKRGLRILVTYHPSPFNYSISKKREAMREAFRRLQDFAGSCSR